MSGPGLRILLVDNSESTRRMVGTILRSRKWVICGEAGDGRSGLEKFVSLRPDVVVLDLAMPDMDGIQVAKLMSSVDGTVPLVLFTFLDIQRIEGAVREAGIRAIVSKTEAWSLVRAIEDIAGEFRGFDRR
jgi:CheY-like chemotaxis protein